MREALEWIAAANAVEELANEARKKQEREQAKYKLGDTEVTVRSDEEAQKLADTPHLTGDPEWDAIELAATDPSRPLIEKGIKVKRGR